MTTKKIIDGLYFTVGMMLFNPATGEAKTPDELNEDDRYTYDACMGAIELLKAQEPIEARLNLCESCTKEYAECEADKTDLIYGSGVGNDNIIGCPWYVNRWKAQEPSVMPWREVIGAALECKPVYIEVRDSEDKERGDDRWAMVTQYKDSMTNGMIRAMSSYITSEILFADCYCKTWRCWTSYPTDERREATPWE